MPNLTEEDIRKIIREELGDFLMDKFVFSRHIQIMNGRNIQVGKGVGTKIGTATTQKLGFYGATPVDRPDIVGDPSGQVDDLDTEARAAINSIIDRLQELGLMSTS